LRKDRRKIREEGNDRKGIEWRGKERKQGKEKNSKADKNLSHTSNRKEFKREIETW
jgi:hypothetical protein